MRPKRKKTAPSAPRRIYTTRQIMDITEQRRQKEETAAQEPDPKTGIPEDLPPSLPAMEASQIEEEIKEEAKEEVKEELNEGYKEEYKEVPKRGLKWDIALTGRVFFILSLTVLILAAFFEFPKSWEHAIADKINTAIVYVTFLILNLIHGPCSLEGVGLNTHYYKISLQGDLVVFYSLELIIIFAVLFAFVQKTTWTKSGMIAILLVPLAMVANLFRLLWACGIALNYGPVTADRYFHGALVGFVFIFIVLGLTILEYLFFPD
jgi:exosortase/archaeosortase family protein